MLAPWETKRVGNTDGINGCIQAHLLSAWTLLIFDLLQYTGAYLPHRIIDSSLLDAKVMRLDPAANMRFLLEGSVALVLAALLAPDR